VNVSIRRLKAGDADDIQRISASITRAYDKTDFERVIAKQTQSEDDASFVAEVEEKVVGYWISYILVGSFGIEKSAWVAMLGVAPKFMGRGIGAMLAAEALRYYRTQGIKDIYTSVRWDSTDLLSFFKTLNFDRSDFINLHRSLE
jgi:ribosomal protein S18 acetylase RimI-like enzyme